MRNPLPEVSWNPSTLDSHDDTQFSRLKEIFAKDSLQMCTFTITEKGYNLNTPDGNFMAAVAEDMKNGPERPESYIGKVAALVYARYVSGRETDRHGKYG